MSWLRSTVHKAMKGHQNIEKYMVDIKNFEEVFTSCNSEEKIMVLRKLLASLEQTESTKRGPTSEDCVGIFESNDDKLKHEQTQLVSQCDLDDLLQDAKLDFRDVFIRSHAVEGMILSTIHEAPNDEESTLILAILRHSIMGEREVHDAIMNSLQGLAKVFSCYHDEVLISRDELLQYAQIAIRGLQVNSDTERIDMAISTLQRKLYKNQTLQHNTNDHDDTPSQQNKLMTMETLQETFSKIRMYLKLKQLLVQKKAIHDGDCSETHAEKVSKLKVLLQSLTKSILTSETRIKDNRYQKDEAMRFRLAKTKEVSKVEKELEAEIETLEQQKGELEQVLQKVNASLIAAKTSLYDVKEERDEFHEANNVILYQLQLKADELSKSIACIKSETVVITALIRFMEDAWKVQLRYLEQLQIQTTDEIETHSKYYAEVIVKLLHMYKVELGRILTRLRTTIRQLKSSEEFDNTYNLDDESFPITVTKTSLEEEFLHVEAKIVYAFDLVDCMKETSSERKKFSRNDEENIEELYNTLEEMKVEFETLERPALQCERENKLTWHGSPINLKPKNDATNNNNNNNNDMYPMREYYIKGTTLDLNLLGLEDGTPESTSAKISKSYFLQDITDWEFDALL